MIVSYVDHVCDLQAHAAERQSAKDTAGIKAHSRFKQSSSRNSHLDGVLGEFAVANFFGVDINRTIYVDGGDQHAGDVLLPNGEIVECKYRSQRFWDFALNSLNLSEFQAQFGCLVWPGPHTYELQIVGYITREKFMAKKRKMNFGNGPRWGVVWQEFDSVQDLYYKVMKDLANE